MIVFKGKLYAGFSSGFQGSALRSSGCEIWRFDGTSWEPVISDKKDRDEVGIITGISDCEEDDKDVTAQVTDRTKNWQPDQWAGGTLQITSGDGIFRRFDIISNTADTLIVQNNEISGKTGSEYTICEAPHYINPFPFFSFDLGTVAAGDSYEIGTGVDENGFGDYWNRGLNSMAIYNDRLYVGTGINYEYGSQVWFTEDGENWQLTQPERSFDVFHNDEEYPRGKKPVVVTCLSLCVSSVSGSEIMYSGGTGSTGDAGRCSRMARLTDNGWELIVDAQVDENDTGTNENGFGDGMDCTMFDGNFMPWTLADFNNRLFVGINSLGGARVLYTPNGSSQDGNWFYSVGGDSAYPNGFNGTLNPGVSLLRVMKIYKNIVANLFATDDYLYAGLISLYVPQLGGLKLFLEGAHIWKTADGDIWEPVTTNGFGDRLIISFQSFTEFNGTLYVAGSKAANSVIGGLGGVRVFQMAAEK